MTRHNSKPSILHIGGSGGIGKIRDCPDRHTTAHSYQATNRGRIFLTLLCSLFAGSIEGVPASRGPREAKKGSDILQGRESGTNCVRVCNFCAIPIIHLIFLSVQFLLHFCCFIVSVQVNEPDCSTLQRGKLVESREGEVSKQRGKGLGRGIRDKAETNERRGSRGL